MKKELIKLIKRSGSVRRFKNKRISSKLLKLILDGGVWGPSIFGVQPWHFSVIEKPFLIKKIASVMEHNIADNSSDGIKKLLKLNSIIVSNARVIIAVYTDNKIKKRARKYGAVYVKKGWVAEILAAGAAMQNMFLLLNIHGLGGVWLDTPTIFSEKINKILHEKDELLAFLAIGYPNQECKRSYREQKKMVRFL